MIPEINGSSPWLSVGQADDGSWPALELTYRMLDTVTGFDDSWSRVSEPAAGAEDRGEDEIGIIVSCRGRLSSLATPSDKLSQSVNTTSELRSSLRLGPAVLRLRDLQTKGAGRAALHAVPLSLHQLGFATEDGHDMRMIDSPTLIDIAL